jgi:hypothetical protein
MSTGADAESLYVLEASAELIITLQIQMPNIADKPKSERKR